ncbi:hypothetical protein B0O80DRAFT_234098 [Mortierella sp. GBAus27b]|nr:hypothetical protein B0O80DRAFT_234098 [Mortierella sp. GBAus27b]
MPLYLTYTHIFTLLVSVSFTTFAHAQTFLPTPVITPCSAFIEGQGLYILGGQLLDLTPISQSFMIDLSVSWDTSSPVLKNLSNSPKVAQTPCTMSRGGEDIFIPFHGVGHIYNLKTDTWTVVDKVNILDGPGRAAATDPETGLMYIVDGVTDSTGKTVMMSLNLGTKTLNTTPMPTLNMTYTTGAWSATLQSMLVISSFSNHVYTFTPTKSNGWSELKTTGDVVLGAFTPCFVSAYGGSKMVLFVGYAQQSTVYILEVATSTWKKSPSFVPVLIGIACGVTGDQFIVWGGSVSDERTSDKTFVYNMKTDKWVTSYTAQSPLQTTAGREDPTSPASSTSLTSPTSPTLPTIPTPRTPDHENASSGDTKLIVIVVVITGVLLVTIQIFIFLYIRRVKRLKANSQTEGPRGSPQGSLDSVETDCVAGASVNGQMSSQELHPRDPVYLGPTPTEVALDTCAGLKLHTSAPPFTDTPSGPFTGYIPVKSGPLHYGVVGTRLDPGHPHTIITTTKRNVQEGAWGARPFSQHPHAIVDQDFFTLKVNNDQG